MQEAMMGFVNTSLIDADVLLIMIDASDKSDISIFDSRVQTLDMVKIVLLNKIDRLSHTQALEKLAFWQQHLQADAYIPISALKKINVDVVQDAIVKHLPESPPYYDKDALTDRPERFFVSEIVREKILLNYKQEIPYSVEVVVESFKEEPTIVRIRALIFVNRASQKPIIIGHKGQKIKKVGTQARKDIETFMAKKVYLELFVKVRENWRDNERLLRNLGYKA
jgi:GTP-binding protein Era